MPCLAAGNAKDPARADRVKLFLTWVLYVDGSFLLVRAGIT